MDTMLFTDTPYRRTGTGKGLEPLPHLTERLCVAEHVSHSSAPKRIDLMPLAADSRITQTHSVYSTSNVDTTSHVDTRLTGVPPCLTVT